MMLAADPAPLGWASTVFVLLVGAGFIGVVLTLMWRPGAPATTRGMKQFAQAMAADPDASRALSDHLRERSRVIDEITSGRATAFATDSEIAGWVEMVLDGVKDEFPLFHEMRLCAVGPRATPFLLRALDDPRCEPKGHTFTGSDVIWSPFQRVAGKLADEPRPELVPRALAWARARDKDVCAIGVRVLGLSGADGAVETLAQVLRTPMPEPTGEAESPAARRRSMLLDARRAIFESVAVPVKKGAATERFRSELTKALWDLVTRSTKYGGGDAFAPLLDLDSESVVRLTSPEFLRLDLDGLGALMEAMVARQHALDPAFLRSVIHAAPTAFASDYNCSRSVKEAGKALARQIGADALPDLEHILTRPDLSSYDRDDAAEAILAAAGLPGFYEIIRHVDGAPRPVEVLDLAAGLSAEYNNGGISQFFFNHTGRTWRECVKALYELGCPVTAKSVARSATTLGLDEGGDPRAQYAELSDEDEKRMSRDARIFGGEEDFVRVTTKYALAHAAEIRGWLQRQASPAAGGTIPLA